MKKLALSVVSVSFLALTSSALTWTYFGGWITAEGGAKFAVSRSGNELTLNANGSNSVGSLSEIDFARVEDEEGNELKIVDSNTSSAILPVGSAIDRLVLPVGLRRVSNRMFNKMSGIKCIVVSEGCLSLDDQSFYNCASLTQVSLPSSLTNIGSQVFVSTPNINFSDLTTAALPNLEAIGGSAFNGNTTIKTVDFSGHTKLATIGSSAFQSCSALQTVSIDGREAGVRVYEAFTGCPELTSITFGKNVTRIGSSASGAQGDYAVVDCPKLSLVQFKGTPQYLGTLNFSWWGYKIDKVKPADYTLRLIVPDAPGATGWKVSYFTDGTALTPWDSLSDELKNEYTSRFGTDVLPAGLMKRDYPATLQNQWIVYVPDEGPEKAVLEISNMFGDLDGADPLSVGRNLQPGFGQHEVAVGEAVECSIDQYATAWRDREDIGKRQGVLYEVTGATLEKKDADGNWTDAGSFVGRTASVTPSEAGFYRLKWNFGIAGYRPSVSALASVAEAESMLGSVSVLSTPDYTDSNGAFYLTNELYCCQVNLADGATFGGWYAGVPEEQKMQTSVSVPVTNILTLSAYVHSGRWMFLSGREVVTNGIEFAIDGRITDGYWKLAVTTNEDGTMVVGWPNGVYSSDTSYWSAQARAGGAPQTASLIDFTKPVDSGHVITGLSDCSFAMDYWRSLGSARELRLPSTLQTIGKMAFYKNYTMPTIVFGSDVEVDETACKSMTEGTQLWKVPPTENWQRFVSENVDRWSSLTDAQRAKWTGEGRPKGLIRGFGQWIRYTKDLGFSLIIR